MNAGPRILVVYAHSAPERSRVNRRLAEVARTLPNVTLRDLYETYPDFSIDVPAEQELLAQADLLVFQHPVQWYGMPALLKEWVDAVLERGWAFGPGGEALRGKDFWLAATTGGEEDSYRESGRHRQEFAAFLPPFRQTARLCGMRWLPPYLLHGAHRVSNETVNAHIEGFRERLASYPRWPEISGERRAGGRTG